MNIAYFGKSNFTMEKTIHNLIEEIKKYGWQHLGEVELPYGQGKMILISQPETLSTILQEDYNLVGLLPCAITVFRKKNDILIGISQLGLLKAASRSSAILKVATEAEKTLKSIIHSAGGVEELKPKQVKLYSTTTCPYCKMEKSWLDSKNIKHEVVYVDLNQKEAESMVQRTGQMGVPVTEIQFNEGEPESIVGFDKQKLANVLGVTA